MPFAQTAINQDSVHEETTRYAIIDVRSHTPKPHPNSTQRKRQQLA
jgi:hypothetical protein